MTLHENIARNVMNLIFYSEKVFSKANMTLKET